MPKINLIKRKWLQQHQLHACLRQAEFLMKKESLLRLNDDDDNNDVDDCSFPQDCDPSSTLASPYSMSLGVINSCPPPKKNKDGNKNASNVRCTDGLSSTPRFQPLVRKISNHSDDDTSRAVNGDTSRAVTPSSEDLKCTEAMREPAIKIKSLETKLTQGLTVIVPAGGTLGLYLEDDTDVDNAGEGGTVVKDVRLSSVLIKQVSPGDRIVSIDGQDVSQLTTSEISTLLALWHSDLDRELVIKPSLASTMPFTNVASHQPSQIHSISIYEGVKRHITANKMAYNEVRVLLQQPGLSKVKQHVAQWYASTPIMSSIYQPDFDIPAASDQPKKKRRRLCYQEHVPSYATIDETGEY